ncbi:zinc finger protein 184 [Latimeria chalumnae]|uniref:zinc finger protein 184 n=1 Tax=Latimeria chalumnae TaxID=7897 RepID=UPI00313E5750
MENTNGSYGSEYLLIDHQGIPYTVLEVDLKRKAQLGGYPMRNVPVQNARNKDTPTWSPKENSKIYQCSECDACFESSHELLRHYLLHIQEKPFECGDCGKCFGRSSNLVRHRMTHTGERPYKCSLCGRGFRSGGELVRHQQVHTGSKPYQCDICCMRFTQRKNLKRHLKKQHGGGVPTTSKVVPVTQVKGIFECLVCDRSFDVLEVFKAHECPPSEDEAESVSGCLTSDLTQITKAPPCGVQEELLLLRGSHEEFSKADHILQRDQSCSFETHELSSHFLSESCRLASEQAVDSTSPSFLCLICREVFENELDLNKHHCTLSAITQKSLQEDNIFSSDQEGAIIDREEKPFSCPVCGKCFRLPTSLERHRWVHAGEGPFQCGECQKRFRRMSQLKAHWLRHHVMVGQFQCTVCEGKFGSPDELLAHKLVHFDEEPYQCGICQERFSELNFLQNHQGKHVQYSSLDNSLFLMHPNLEPEAPEPLYSPLNRTRTPGKEDYHHCFPSELIESTHCGRRLYKCTACSKRLNTFANLAVHYIEHTKHKPFKCFICGETFKKSTYLEQHKLVHTNQRPFKCEVCKKGFRNKCDLQRHHLVHTGEKPFQCSVCHMRFTQKSHLHRHRRRQHDRKPAYYDIIMEIKNQRVESSPFEKSGDEKEQEP